MKALEILEKNQSTKERAKTFIESIRRNLEKKIIDTLQEKIEAIEDKIYGLLDMSLNTDLNKGVETVTRDQAEARFSKVIELEYELELLNRELEIKRKSFDNYFSGVEEAIQ
jgi:ectoine hydroxylase-related dioxygenase (phytanoyl-CoA dioxygenase family)